MQSQDDAKNDEANSYKAIKEGLTNVINMVVPHEETTDVDPKYEVRSYFKNGLASNLHANLDVSDYKNQIRIDKDVCAHLKSQTPKDNIQLQISSEQIHDPNLSLLEQTSFEHARKIKTFNDYKADYINAQISNFIDEDLTLSEKKLSELEHVRMVEKSSAKADHTKVKLLTNIVEEAIGCVPEFANLSNSIMVTVSSNDQTAGDIQLETQNCTINEPTKRYPTQTSVENNAEASTAPANVFTAGDDTPETSSYAIKEFDQKHSGEQIPHEKTLLSATSTSIDADIQKYCNTDESLGSNVVEQMPFKKISKTTKSIVEYVQNNNSYKTEGSNVSSIEQLSAKVDTTSATSSKSEQVVVDSELQQQGCGIKVSSGNLIKRLSTEANAGRLTSFPSEHDTVDFQLQKCSYNFEELNVSLIKQFPTEIKVMDTTLSTKEFVVIDSQLEQSCCATEESNMSLIEQMSLETNIIGDSSPTSEHISIGSRLQYSCSVFEESNENFIKALSTDINTVSEHDSQLQEYRCSAEVSNVGSFETLSTKINPTNLSINDYSAFNFQPKQSYCVIEEPNDSSEELIFSETSPGGTASSLNDHILYADVKPPNCADQCVESINEELNSIGELTVNIYSSLNEVSETPLCMHAMSGVNCLKIKSIANLTFPVTLSSVTDYFHAKEYNFNIVEAISSEAEQYTVKKPLLFATSFSHELEKSNVQVQMDYLSHEELKFNLVEQYSCQQIDLSQNVNTTDGVEGKLFDCVQKNKTPFTKFSVDAIATSKRHQKAQLLDYKPKKHNISFNEQISLEPAVSMNDNPQQKPVHGLITCKINQLNVEINSFKEPFLGKCIEYKALSMSNGQLNTFLVKNIISPRIYSQYKTKKITPNTTQIRLIAKSLVSSIQGGDISSNQCKFDLTPCSDAPRQVVVGRSDVFPAYKCVKRRNNIQIALPVFNKHPHDQLRPIVTRLVRSCTHDFMLHETRPLNIDIKKCIVEPIPVKTYLQYCHRSRAVKISALEKQELQEVVGGDRNRNSAFRLLLMVGLMFMLMFWFTIFEMDQPNYLAAMLPKNSCKWSLTPQLDLQALIRLVFQAKRNGIPPM